MRGKTLIIGANGLIGRAVAGRMKQGLWAGTAYSRNEEGLLGLDVTDEDNLRKVFEEVRPRRLIHCANLAGGLDFYERNPGLAKRFHYDATVNIGNLCRRYNTRFIFLSSECVFDGKKESYCEEDPVSPISVYGRLKAESERWVIENVGDYVIIRAMSVYGWDPMTVTPNAVMKVYFSVSKGKRIGVPVFRWGTPTYVGDLADALLELSVSSEKGIIHVAGPTFINRYDWLSKTAAALGWDAGLIAPIMEADSKELLRPLKVLLDTHKFRQRYTTKLRSLQEGIRLLKEDYSKNEEGILQR